MINNCSLKPLLSFCIPTYNRATLVDKCVKTILSSECEDIEVVVSDNGSNDNTMEVLTKIDDSRFKYFRNEKNEGFAYNLNQVLKVASGNFCLLLSDEDEVNLESIIPMIEIIKENCDCSLLFGQVLSKDQISNEWKVYKSKRFKIGDEAIVTTAFKHSYLGGIIVNRRNYSMFEIEERNWYEKEIFYPHEYLCFKLALAGDVLLFKNIILWTFEYKAVTHSGTKLINTAYGYEGRLQTFKDRTLILINSSLVRDLKLKLVLENYKNLLTAGIVNVCMQNNDSYGIDIKCKKMSTHEFIKKFYNDSIALIKNNQIEWEKEINKKMRIINFFVLLKICFLKLFKGKLYMFVKHSWRRAFILINRLSN